MNNLFEVVILEKPTINEQNDGKLPRIVVGPKLLIAKDASHAAVLVGLDKDLPEFDRSRMDIIVRPF